MKEKSGKFIVLYGINNLGKSTQAKILVQKMNDAGLKAEYLKYPIYDLAPTGPMINSYLRQGNPYGLTPREAQIIYTLNRFHFEATLKAKLAQGINIVAEDYTGTGLAWGMGAGVNEGFLKELNSALLKEDLALLFYGQRFKQAVESGHRHEEDDDLTNKVREAHEKLGQEFGWVRINANQPVKKISEEIWREVKKIL